MLGPGSWLMFVIKAGLRLSSDDGFGTRRGLTWDAGVYRHYFTSSSRSFDERGSNVPTYGWGDRAT